MLGVGGGAQYKMYKSLIFIILISRSKKVKTKMLTCVWSLCSANKLLRLLHFVSVLTYKFWISWRGGTARTLLKFANISILWILGIAKVSLYVTTVNWPEVRYFFSSYLPNYLSCKVSNHNRQNNITAKKNFIRLLEKKAKIFQWNVQFLNSNMNFKFLCYVSHLPNTLPTVVNVWKCLGTSSAGPWPQADNIPE
jgi:hypothetical protein